VNKFRDAFQVAGEIQEIAADKETAALLKRYDTNPDVQNAAGEFDRAQKSKSDSLRISMGKTSPNSSEPCATAGGATLLHCDWKAIFLLAGNMGYPYNPGQPHGTRAIRSKKNSIVISMGSIALGGRRLGAPGFNGNGADTDSFAP
jgi:hypothetical protein